MEETSTQAETVEQTGEQQESTEVQVPEWFKADKYGSIEDQAKAYTELEKRFGGFTGAPEEYKLNEGVEGLNDSLMGAINELGRKHNMSNEMYNELISTVNEIERTEYEQFQQRELEGLGENGQQRIDNVNGWLQANAPEALREMLGTAVQTAEHVEALEQFISSMKGQAPANVAATPQGQQYTEEGYMELLNAKDEHGRDLNIQDPAHLNKTRAYLKALLEQRA